jgi:hypothetical protein
MSIIYEWKVAQIELFCPNLSHEEQPLLLSTIF